MHERTQARAYERMHASTQARTHARTLARTYATRTYAHTRTIIKKSLLEHASTCESKPNEHTDEHSKFPGLQGSNGNETNTAGQSAVSCSSSLLVIVCFPPLRLIKDTYPLSVTGGNHGGHMNLSHTAKMRWGFAELSIVGFN